MTWHNDPSESFLISDQNILGSHYRLATDFRYDGIIGFWNENSYLNSNNLDLTMISLGGDYTFPYLNGILLMIEYMSIFSKPSNVLFEQNFLAFMSSMPIGMTNQITFISEMDLNENRNYNYLQWSNTYDDYSLNFIMSINPKRMDYGELEQFLPKYLAGFGTGIQFMFIYNH